MSITRTIQQPKYNRRKDEGLPGKGFDDTQLFLLPLDKPEKRVEPMEENKSSIKKAMELVKDKKAIFVKVQERNLWYLIEGTNFMFPIPIQDTDGGVFGPSEDAFILKRWVRKHIESLEKEKHSA